MPTPARTPATPTARTPRTAGEAGARTGVVIVAAGAGTRLGYGRPKALVPLAGRSLLEHALDGVVASAVARRIVVVVPPGDTELTGICTRFARDAGPAGRPPVSAVAGGASRSESVVAGLAALDEVDFVLVHDAARCLAPDTVFTDVVAALCAGASAVVPAVPVVDTIKTVAGAKPGADAGPETSAATRALPPGHPAPGDAHGSPSGRPAREVVTGTPDRSALRAVQTPQGFRLDELLAAHGRFEGTESAAITDDALLMELAGAVVHVVPGSAQAMKITTPVDLLLAEALIANGYAPGHEEKP